MATRPSAVSPALRYIRYVARAASTVAAMPGAASTVAPMPGVASTVAPMPGVASALCMLPVLPVQWPPCHLSTAYFVEIGNFAPFSEFLHIKGRNFPELFSVQV